MSFQNYSYLSKSFQFLSTDKICNGCFFVDGLYGSFLSKPIKVSNIDGFLKWRSLNVVSENISDSFIYFRGGNGETFSKWELNTTFFPTEYEYIQFLIILKQVVSSDFIYGVDVFPNPTITSLDIYYDTIGAGNVFVTKYFELDFVPKSILLTDNATVDTIADYYVSKQDSVDNLLYKKIEKNKINDLTSLSSDMGIKIKIVLHGSQSEIESFGFTVS
jgi:hypothetical protein